MMDVWGTGGDVYAVGTWAPGPIYPDAGVADGDGGASVDAAPTFPSGGFVVRSLNGGATWHTVRTDAPCSLWHVRGTPDGQAVYATGACGSMVWTTDHGASWSVMGSTTLAASKYGVGAPWVSAAGTTYFPLEVKNPGEIGASVCNWFLASDSLFAPTGCATVPGRRQENAGTIWARPTGAWGLGEDEVWAYGPQGMFWRKR